MKFIWVLLLLPILHPTHLTAADTTTFADPETCVEEKATQNPLCVVGVDTTCPAQSDCKVIDKVSGFRDLYLGGNQTCRPASVLNGEINCTTNADCCSKSCVQNSCAPTAVCVKKVGLNQTRCGVAECGRHQMPRGPNSSTQIEEELIAHNDTCVLAESITQPHQSTEVRQIDLSREIGNGAQCQAIISEEDNDFFHHADSYLKGAEYMMAEHTLEGSYADKFGFLKVGHKIGLDLQKKRQELQKELEEKFQSAVTQINSLKNDPEFDPTGSKMLRLQGDMIEAIAINDAGLAELYIGTIRDEEGHLLLTQEGVAVIDTDKPNFSGRVEELGLKIKNRNWGCYKWMDRDRGFFKPCRCSIGDLNKNLMWTGPATGGITTIISFFSGFAKKGKDRDCAKSCIPYQDKTKIVDGYWPKKLRANGKSLNVEAITGDFIRYATQFSINSEINYTNAGPGDYNPFGTQRRASLAQMAAKAESFFYFYGQGGCSLPGATKARTMLGLATIIVGLADYHIKAHKARNAQANCLRFAADMREARQSAAVTLLDQAGGDLASPGDSNAPGELENAESIERQVDLPLANIPGIQSFSQLGSNALTAKSSSLRVASTRARQSAQLAQAKLLTGAQRSSSVFSKFSTRAKNELNRIKKSAGELKAKNLLDRSNQFVAQNVFRQADPEQLPKELNSGNPNQSAQTADQKTLAKEKSPTLLSSTTKIKKVSSVLPDYGYYQPDTSSPQTITDLPAPTEVGRHPSGLDQGQVEDITKAIKFSQVKINREDSLFKKISKAYVLYAYPNFFKRKPK